jgi:hypothetical protein
MKLIIGILLSFVLFVVTSMMAASCATASAAQQASALETAAVDEFGAVDRQAQAEIVKRAQAAQDAAKGRNELAAYRQKRDAAVAALVSFNAALKAMLTAADGQPVDGGAR